MSADKIDIGFCRLHNLNINEAMNQVQDLAKSNSPHIVVTPNMDHAERLCRRNGDADFISAYSDSSLVLCDSRILQKLAQWAGVGIPNVVEGSTLTAKIFDDLLAPEHKICILGGNENVITNIREKYPTLNIFHSNPSMGFINNAVEVEAICRYVRELNPDFIFLALGSPQQELLAKRIKFAGLNRGVIMCIGASLLFLTDLEKRAPHWVRRLRMEWFYRMMQNPRRLASRYFSNACAAATIFKQIKMAGVK
ncbi:WecB/TagA/CpsF family glycosyltransferase [Microbulbifer aggregans]|uniref:WecB/TagA/CpsF family glycosyltransferase n=1 Tax=Microbulbifer aggregans TaxID=1769779 RepID=UPI001CFD9D9B|nr:WecB/TagA/CpsF family glycosyltransferase [Microbulbifer aggregans]